MSDYDANNPNSGHGHVFKRPDGVVARCGGPFLCDQCAQDRLKYFATFDLMPKVDQAGNVKVEPDIVGLIDDIRKQLVEMNKRLSRLEEMVNIVRRRIS